MYSNKGACKHEAKSDLRVFIEDYQNSGDEDWLEIPCKTKQETNRVRSIAYSIDRTIIDTSNKCNGITYVMIHK